LRDGRKLGSVHEYLLVVKVLGVESLDQTLGTTVVDAALADLAPSVADLISRVLSLAQITGPAIVSQRGCWTAPFSLSSDSLLQSGISERVISIAAAANELTHAAAQAIFGTATAPLAALTAACIARNAGGDLAKEMQAVASLRLDTASRATLKEIIDQQMLRTVFQPIVRVHDGRVVGVEALSRGPVGSAFESADQLFGAAARCGLTHELELTCAAQALTYLDRLPEPLWMSVNASAATLPDIYAHMSARRINGSRVMLELTEHLPLGRIGELLPTLNGLRRLGAQIALDDTGCGYADLEAAVSVEANLVKLCITVIGRMEHHKGVRAEVAKAVRQARSHGAQVLAEGVETIAQARILSEIGVHLAQGWLYGKPFPANDLETLVHSVRPARAALFAAAS
jgi:EAL domain-containing protein (putative c-di-GMP-specific phosphodiesterase class I)